jgi:serine/threonine-protein kinase
MTETIHKAGDQIGGRYIVERFLAAGGMQEVYIAEDSVLKRRIALKTPKNDSAAKRFETSASLSARMSHPYVAKTYDYLLAGGRAYLVEELVNGCNLHDFTARIMTVLDPHLVAQCAHQFSKALSASHHVGVIHRDLKPNNIIVVEQQECLNFKVTDFGIAKLAEEELEKAHKSNETIQNSSTMFGALPYMSPEVIYNPKASGKASDVWAFGAIIYTLLTGSLPFGEGLGAIPRIVSGLPPATPTNADTLHQFKPLSTQLWELITPCLNVDPNGRPNAEQLAEQTSKICYSAFPRHVGRIKSYKPSNYGAYGFIQTDGDDVFFHRDSYFGAEVIVGQLVYFSAHPGNPRDRAHPIVPVRNVASFDSLGLQV